MVKGRRLNYVLGFMASGCFMAGYAYAAHRWAGLAFGLAVTIGAKWALPDPYNTTKEIS